MNNSLDGSGNNSESRPFRGSPGEHSYPIITPEKEVFYCSQMVDLRNEIVELEASLGLHDGDSDFNEEYRWERKPLNTFSDAKLRSLYGKLYKIENDFLMHFMGFVTVEAWRFSRKIGVRIYDDYVQEGYLAILHALSRFDFDRGVKFVTYARFWLHRSFSRSSVRFSGRLNGASLHAYTYIARYNKLLDENGNLSKEDEKNLKLLIGVDKKTIDEMMKMNRSMNMVSLSRQVVVNKNEGNSMELMDSLSPEMLESSFGATYDVGCGEDIVDRVINNEQLSLIEDSIAGLSARDKLLFKGIYSDECGENMADLGKVYGISRERVRQIHDKTINGIRKKLRSAIDL